MKRYTAEILNQTTGLQVLGATLEVFLPSTQVRAVLYSANDRNSAAVSQPVPNGVSFYPENGYYDLVARNGVRTTTILGVELYDLSEAVRGPTGYTGPADNTYTTLGTFKGSDTTRRTASLVGIPGVPDGRFFWTSGDFTNQADEINVIQAIGTALTIGAWVRQGARLPNIITDGRDNTAFLQAQVTAGDLTIPARAQPYVVSTPVVMPAGRQIQIEPGTRFTWTGGQPTTLAHNEAVFRMADNSLIACGGEWRVECAVETPFLSCVSGFGVQNVRVHGAFGLNCTQAWFDAPAGYAGYDAVVTTTMKAAGDPRAVNTNRTIAVIGGGCDFPNHTPSGALGQPERAGALMFYCEDWEVRDGRYSGAYCPVQYWGGDSGLATFQDMGRLGPNAERKNVHGRMTNLLGRRLGAGCWGSMGRDIQVTNCRCYDVGDVGHDHEGSIDVTMTGCHAEDCKNGNYAVFSYCKRITILNCTSRSTAKEYPLFRAYNVSQTQNNDDVSIQGGLWQCTDPTGPARMDTSFGPARQISLSGAELVNALVDFNTLNNCRVVVAGNRLSFPFASAVMFKAVSVGGNTGSGFGNPESTVDGNTIYSAVSQPVGTVAIYGLGVDFNAAAHFRIANNRCWVPVAGGVFAALKAAHSGSNAGLVSYFVFFGNQVDGQIQTTSAGAASPGVFAGIQNFNSAGAAVALTAV